VAHPTRRPRARPRAAAPALAAPALAAAALLAAGCEAFTGVGSVAEPALLVISGDTARIAAPDSVAPGVAFEVRVVTFGGGCTRAVAGTEVRDAPDGVEVRPYNRREEASGCTRDLLYLEHRAAVRLATPGVHTLRVLGATERRGADGRVTAEPAELTRRVVVR
jgi:hypothetical protein